MFHSNGYKLILQLKAFPIPVYFSYKSPFTYSDAKKTDGYSSFVDMEDAVEYEEAKQGCILRFLTHFLTACSYITFAVTLPISYFFCIKTLRSDERMVVFRLGKMIGR